MLESNRISNYVCSPLKLYLTGLASGLLKRFFLFLIEDDITQHLGRVGILMGDHLVDLRVFLHWATWPSSPWILDVKVMLLFDDWFMSYGMWRTVRRFPPCKKYKTMMNLLLRFRDGEYFD